MTLEFSKEELPNHVILFHVCGRLDHESVPDMEAALLTLIGEDNTRIIIDLQHATYINSGGLRVLITVWRMVRRRGGDMHLCGLNQRLADIFEMAGFEKVFTIHQTVDEAIKALA